MTKARTKQKDTNEPAFSPDGRYLYFSDDATPGEIFEYSKDPNGQIYVIQRLDRQTNEVEPYVTGPAARSARRPRPTARASPSSAATGTNRPSSARHRSGRETPLTDTLDRDMQETWAVHGVYPGISWTPDSRSIVYWAGGSINRIDVACGRSATSRSTSPAPASSRTRCASREVAPDRFDVKMVRFAKASPDGRRVVYEALGHLWIKDAAGGAAAPADPRRRHSSSTRPGRATGARSSIVSWNDDNAGRVKVVCAGGGTGRDRHARAGPLCRAGLLARRQTIAFRKTSDGYLTTPLWGRDTGHLCRAGARRNSARGRQGRHASRSSARPATGCSSWPTRRRRSARCLGRPRGRAGDDAPDRRRTRPSSRSRPMSSSLPGPSATRPMSCRSPAPAGRSTSRPRQGAAAGAGQHRRRRLGALVGQRAQPLLDAGAAAVPPRSRHARAPSPAASRHRRRRSPLGFAADAGEPSRNAGADRRADRHHARRRGDRERHGADRRQPHRRGRADRSGQLSGRHAHHRRQPARPSSRA